MFSKRPEAIVSCLLCEIMYAPNRVLHCLSAAIISSATTICNTINMYKTECIVIYGARCFAETDGYGEKFVFTRAAQPPLPAATTSVLGHAVAASAGWPPRAAHFPVLPLGSNTQWPPHQLNPIFFLHKTIIPFSSRRRRQILRTSHRLAAAAHHAHARRRQSPRRVFVGCSCRRCGVQTRMHGGVGLRGVQRRSIREVLGAGQWVGVCCCRAGA